MRVFLDTSVMLGGLIDLGPQSAAAQRIMAAVAEGQVPDPGSAWHCCLEFYSVATRLPAEFRLKPVDAQRLLREEILARLAIADLPPGDRQPLLDAAVQDGIGGGRIYDAHMAEIARAAGARVIVTDNRRHFLAALRHGLKVETPAEFLADLKKRLDALS
ncbi:MAG: PIN domain-containing protein [Vicinamibacterales bacterium]